jgi:hypothetical protein
MFPTDTSMTLTSVAGLPSSGQIRALLSDGVHQEIVIAPLPANSSNQLSNLTRRAEPVGGDQTAYPFNAGATVEFIYTAQSLTNNPRNMSAPGDLETLDTSARVTRLPGGPAGQSPAFSPLANATLLTNFLQYTAHRGFSPKDFGAVADGTNHPLSELYGTSLTAAQADFPFVTALSQSRDAVALQQCFNLAQTADSFHFGKNVYIPAGSYYLDNTINVQGIYAMTCRGDGQATKLYYYGSATAGPLKITSCQSCTFQDFSINRGTANPTYGIWLTNTNQNTDSIVSSSNNFRRIQVNDGFINCVQIVFDTGGDANNDLHIFEDCVFKQFQTNGVGIHGGQVHQLRFIRCGFTAASTSGTAGIYSNYGAYMYIESCTLNACQNNVSTSDFYTGTIVIRNCNSEGSRTFANISGATCPVLISGCRGAMAPQAGDYVLNLTNGGGTIVIEGNNFYTTNSQFPLVLLNFGYDTVVHVNNVYTPGSGTWAARGAGGALVVGPSGTGGYSVNSLIDQGNLFRDANGTTFFDVGESPAPNTPAALANSSPEFTCGPGRYQRWSSTQAVVVDGMTGSAQLGAGYQGEVREIWNVGSFNITFVNLSSAAAHKSAAFTTSTGSDLVLGPGQAALARYDAMTNPDMNDNPQGSWRVSLVGPPRSSALRVTADITLAPQDRFVEIDASSNNVSVIVPAGFRVSGGTEVVLKRIDNNSSHTVTYIVDGPGTIDGYNSNLPLVAQGSWVRLTADGTANAWYITGSDRWAAGDFGVGMGVGGTISGLTVQQAVNQSALGSTNVRMGVSGDCQVLFEKSGNVLQLAFNGSVGYLGRAGAAIFWQFAFADGSLGIGGSAPDPSATLDLQSTTKGLRLPNVSNPSSISSPAEGLLVFNTTTKKLTVWDGGVWQEMTSA